MNRSSAALCVLFAACTPMPGGDAGVGPDAGAVDAGAVDAGRDAGATDSGLPDAGPRDAGNGCGWPLDSGPSSGGCPAGSPGPTGGPPTTLPLDAGAVVHANVTYGVRGGRVLQGDLWLPAPGATPKGILVMVHGGGWGDCNQRRDVVSPFAGFFMATQDVAVFNIEYRLAQEGGVYPANLGDVKCAVQFITAQAATYGLDPTRVLIIGESAGAHLALMTAMTQDRADLDPGCSAQPPRVKAAFAYSPPTNLPALVVARGAALAYTEGPCTTPVTTCGASCDRCIDASPLAHACTSPAKVMLVQAPDPFDALIPASQSVSLAAALADAGAQVRLLIADAGAIRAQTWVGLSCADAGISHGFQSACLLNPTYVELAAAIQDALGP
ncbi:MAG: alpha/beta hydrolase [Myxococcaceae bacterium]|nr:alpha/beta hydrolase [Myxococcaceae bacterium]